MAMRIISITDIGDFKLGNAENREKGTGCTVIVCEEGAVGGVDVRGGGPATRETDLLRSENTVNSVNAVMLSGGSSFGLEAASGAMRELADRNIGYDVGDGIVVPIVCGASLYDLAIGDPKAFPDVNMGIQAVRNAYEDAFAKGNHGAGTGATVGKMMGYGRAMKTGLGTFACGDGTVEVGAIAAVNAVGDIYNGAGNIIAGLRSEDGESIYGTIKTLKGMVHDSVSFIDDSTSFIDRSEIEKVLTVARKSMDDEGSAPEETAPEEAFAESVSEEPAEETAADMPAEEPAEVPAQEQVEEPVADLPADESSEECVSAECAEEECASVAESAEDEAPEAPAGEYAAEGSTAEEPAEAAVPEGPAEEAAREETYEEYAEIAVPEAEEAEAAEEAEVSDEIETAAEEQAVEYEEPEDQEPEEEEPVVLTREEMGYDITFNTTISCLITNAALTKSQANKLASILHDAYARAIKPVHGTLDGDTVFVLATGKQPVNFDAFAALATDVMQYAIIDGALSAKGAYGLPAARDMERPETAK